MQRDPGSFFLRDTLGRILGIKDKLDQDAAVIPRFAWADKPGATSVPVGTQIQITDYGVGAGLLMVSDGALWVPRGPQILSRSAVAVPHTGDTAETALATISVPAGAMGLNGGLLIYSTWSWTNSADDKIARTRFGGIAGTAYWSNTATTTVSGADMRRIRNRGSASSQVGGAANTAALVVASSGAIVTSAVNTAVAADLVLSGQLEAAGDTITLENREIWLLP